MYLGTSLHERNVHNLKIAVVSDVISEKGYFPIWHSYYASAVGEENIFLFSYRNKIHNSIVLNLSYSDGMRLKIITYQVEKLLEIYDVVVRVDADEFLIPMNGTLKDYLENLEKDYVTARGFNVFQSDDQPLDLKLPILKQRNLMYATAFMNKTCITKTPLKWSKGFHFCNKPPAFDDLCLIHLKYADDVMEQEWQSRMISNASERGIIKHYSTKHEFRGYPIEENIQRDAFNQLFMSKVSQNEGMYSSILHSEKINLVIPEKLKIF